MQKWEGSYEKLCERLDSLLVQYFALYDNLVEQRASLTDHFKTGHFHLSKAKYSMGPQKISPLSYHMGMKANKILRVNCSCENEKQNAPSSSSLSSSNNGDDNDNNGDNNNNTAVVVVGQCCCFSEDISVDTDDDGDDSDKDSGPYLRKSVLKEDDTTPTKQRKTLHTERDPLKWFGLFASSQLKLAQRSFTNTITQSIEIANIQHKMNAIEVEFNRLKEIKNGMNGSSSSNSNNNNDNSIANVDKVTKQFKKNKVNIVILSLSLSTMFGLNLPSPKVCERA